MQKYANLVELEKCCQTHIFLQNFVLIQPRTSPPKICKILLIFPILLTLTPNPNLTLLEKGLIRAMRAALLVGAAFALLEPLEPLDRCVANLEEVGGLVGKAKDRAKAAKAALEKERQAVEA